MKIRQHFTSFVCHCGGRIMAQVGKREMDEIEHDGVGLQGFFCEDCGIEYSKYVMEPRWGDVVRAQGLKSSDERSREKLLEEVLALSPLNQYLLVNDLVASSPSQVAVVRELLKKARNK